MLLHHIQVALKRMNKLLNTNKETLYYSHTCACGCGGKIKIGKNHIWDGLPKYTIGHNSKTGRKPNKCCVETCDLQAYAKGLCNGHYIQNRKSKELSPKIKQRIKNGVCKFKDCKELIKNHGGYGFCKRHYSNYRRNKRMKELVKLLGDQCSRCNLQFPLAVYDFHHIDPLTKKFSIGQEVNNYSMEKLMEEVKKCELLCANCHRIKTFEEIHYE